MSAKRKIIIIDDHDLFRDSLRQIIERSADFEVIGEAADARNGESIALELRPDLAVVDLSLPDKSGIQLSRILNTLLPDIRIVIVSMHAKIDYIMSALRAGAFGYIVKESVSKCLFNAFEAVLRGEYYLDPALSMEIVQKLLDFPEQENAVDSAYGDLTPREQEILRLLAQGSTVKDIAEKLFISPKTVTNHRANIMTKLDLHNTVELVRYATRLGLLGDI